MDRETYALLKHRVDKTLRSILPGFNNTGSVSAASDLPDTGNEEGDLKVVEADGSQWYWNGTEWILLNKTATNDQIDELYL